MSSFSFRRAVLALVLGMALVSPWASASELRSRAAHRPAQGVVQEARELFGSLWGIFAGAWIKNGASADPFGGRSQASTSTTSNCEAGASADPNGRCVAGH
jgi:hypothetical protein